MPKMPKKIKDRMKRNAISAQKCRQRKRAGIEKLEAEIQHLQKQKDMDDEQINVIGTEKIELEMRLSIFEIGTIILNDESEEGSVSALRYNALLRLMEDSPRGAKLSIMKDICQWDISACRNDTVLFRILNTPDHQITAAFIEDVCHDLLQSKK